MKIKHSLLAAAVAALASFGAQADPYRVSVTGVIDFNVMGNSMAGIPKGTAVSMSFLVDSDNYLNSPNGLSTRGYNIDLASFSMRVGDVGITMNPNQEKAYFVLRNNDPKIDGVFFSRGTDMDSRLAVLIPGFTAPMELNFLRTFAGLGPGQIDPTFTSLNIADAVGTYGYDNISVHSWGLGSGGFVGAELTPLVMTISAVPEPASVAMLSLSLGLGALVIGARRRKAALA